MLQRQSKAVAMYLERASSAYERAAHTTDPEMRKFHEGMSSKWMDLAASTAFVERVDLFVHSITIKKLPPAELCRNCQRRMRLAMIEADAKIETYTFDCRGCGTEQVRQSR